MIRHPVLKYVLNCFILLIPIALWNIALTSSLPVAFAREVFWRDIPPAVGIAENVLRVIVFVVPLLMPLMIATRRPRIGWGIYLAGLAI